MVQCDAGLHAWCRLARNAHGGVSHAHADILPRLHMQVSLEVQRQGNVSESGGLSG
jgi:hypothetical protein